MTEVAQTHDVARPGKPRIPTWWFVGIGVLLALYLGVLALYAQSTQPQEIRDLSSPDKITVYVQPMSVSPAEETVGAFVSIVPPDAYLDEQGLIEPINIEFAYGGTVVKFDKGDSLLQQQAKLLVSHSSYERYPLDSYRVPVLVQAVGISDTGPEALPVQLVIAGKFPGWHVNSTNSQDVISAEDAEYYEIPAEVLDLPNAAVAILAVNRSASTAGIVGLLLVAMIVLAALGLLVARSVASRRRRIEATMASWFAAMLFALIPLRTNMPGSPPIGVWIDFLFVLWVMILLMVALAIFIGSWLRMSPEPEPESTNVQ